MKNADFAALVRRRLREIKRSKHGAARAGGLPADAIRSVLEGHTPKMDRAAAICAAVGLEFYIGPPRSSNEALLAVRERGPEDGWPRGEDRPPAWVEGLREDIRFLGERLAAQEERGGPARQVEVRELAAAAGGGATELDERVVGFVSFQRSWLDRLGVEPTQCTVISVTGDSMEPTVPGGSKILVDRSKRRQRANRIYVIWTGYGLVVKRAKKDPAGQWLLASDNPSLPATPWPESARVIGEVKWVARSL